MLGKKGCFIFLTFSPVNFTKFGVVILLINYCVMRDMVPSKKLQGQY